MDQTMIVARLMPGSGPDVARIFAESDAGPLPRELGVRERSLYALQDVYIHIVQFDGDAAERMEAAQTTSGFREISERLADHIKPYDPETWRSPADAMARRFYHWTAEEVAGG